MLTINLKSRFRNKAFLLAMVGAIVLLIQQLGFKDIIPSNYADIVNSILTILTMLGIVVDTSTSGLSDQVIVTTETTGSRDAVIEEQPIEEPIKVDETDIVKEPEVDVVALQTELADAKAKLDQVQNLIAPATTIVQA